MLSYILVGTYIFSFFHIIIRWDISALDQSPDYMKVCFQAQLDVFTEIEEKITSEGNLYAIHHARESVSLAFI